MNSWGSLRGWTEQRFEGDAQLEIDDFSSSDVDLALTGIAVASGHTKREGPASGKLYDWRS